MKKDGGKKMGVLGVLMRTMVVVMAVVVPFSGMTVYSSTGDPNTVAKVVNESFYLTTGLEEIPDVPLSQIKTTYRYDPKYVEYYATVDNEVDGGSVTVEVANVDRFVDITFTYTAPATGTISQEALFYAEFKCKHVTGMNGIKFPINSFEVKDLEGTILTAEATSPDTLIIVPRPIKIIGRMFSDAPTN